MRRRDALLLTFSCSSPPLGGEENESNSLQTHDAFQRQQLPLGRQPAAAREAAFLAAAGEYAMAGHDDGNGIARAGHADRARSRAQRHRHAAIGRGLAVRDLAHHRPDPVLEIGAARGEWQVEALELAAEVTLELARRLLEDPARRPVAAALPRAPPTPAGPRRVVPVERE